MFEIKEILVPKTVVTDQPGVPVTENLVSEESVGNCPLPEATQEVGHASTTREEILAALASSEDDDEDVSGREERCDGQDGKSGNGGGNGSGSAEPDTSAAPFAATVEPMETSVSGDLFMSTCKNLALCELMSGSSACKGRTCIIWIWKFLL